MKSREARRQKQKETRIKLARARIRKLRVYEYLPDNADDLIEAAEKAVEACKNYPEYSSLKASLEKNMDYILNLPETSASPKPRNTPQPQQTPQPQDTMEPDEREED